MEFSNHSKGKRLLFKPIDMLPPIIITRPQISPYIIPGLKGRRTQTTQDIIIDTVCNYYNIVFDVLCKKKRDAKIVEPRQVAAYLMCYYTKMSLKKIGELLGGFDHTTIIHCRDTVNNLLCTDKELAIRIQTIKEKAELSDKPVAKPSLITRR